MNDQVEIRLLGRLRIRLGNGTVVPTSEWTGTTTDVIRLLALRADQVVSTKSLTNKLWPDVPDATGAARLHSAAVQIRKVLGKDSITRHHNGLQLRGCWVDVVEHQVLGAELAEAMGSRDFVRVISAAKHAEALYVDDFHAHDDETSWASGIRDDLRTQRKLMLVDAAESAVELGWLHDAIEMSTLAIGLDPCFEPAHQTLMRAYAGIGEIDSATRTYERCRRNLKTVLGVNPSPTTEAVHHMLMSGTSSLRGLALVSDSLTVLPTASVTFRVLMAQLGPTELELCQLMTVLDRPASAVDIMDLLGSQRRTEQRRIEIEACMDLLTRRGIFQASDDMYAFRDRTTQDLFELWLRPSLQVRISQRIDEQGVLLTQSG